MATGNKTRLKSFGKTWKCLLMYLFAHTPISMAQTPESIEFEPHATWQFKLTPSVYQTSHQPSASDLNLRANASAQTLWIGQYDQAAQFHQTRLGYEYALDTEWGKVTPSIQAASGGFWGGSLNAQWGKTTYLMAGWGRTNLREYYNLNFDPNDALTFGVGGLVSDSQQWSIWRTQDDRLQTGQRVTHLLWRYRLPSGQRLTLDVATKKGRSDPSTERVKGNSLSATWDWSRYFLRLAWDQKVNFSDEDQKRLSLGWHF
ncbi:hypothetical protein [Limnohabitans sp. Jir72]|uniref:hypothetical protein n=1 Tax=Limnohabitans sp. Jir72 TaxID=1977909 RepID=UPI0011B1D483|nr:hypothetical protein [Limnohabitans sp. Jir72]